VWLFYCTYVWRAQLMRGMFPDGACFFKINRNTTSIQSFPSHNVYTPAEQQHVRTVVPIKHCSHVSNKARHTVPTVPVPASVLLYENSCTYRYRSIVGTVRYYRTGTITHLHIMWIRLGARRKTRKDKAMTTFQDALLSLLLKKSHRACITANLDKNVLNTS